MRSMPDVDIEEPHSTLHGIHNKKNWVMIGGGGCRMTVKSKRAERVLNGPTSVDHIKGGGPLAGLGIKGTGEGNIGEKRENGFGI